MATEDTSPKKLYKVTVYGAFVDYVEASDPDDAWEQAVDMPMDWEGWVFQDMDVVESEEEE